MELGCVDFRNNSGEDLFLDLERCCILVVGHNNPITEFLPLLSPDAGSLVFFLTRKTAVLDAPQRELFPTMKRHCWCTNHDLIKLEGYRVAVSYVAPVSRGGQRSGKKKMCKGVEIKTYLNSDGLSLFTVQGILRANISG